MRSLVLAAAILGGLAGSAKATVMIPLSIESMSAEADLVVRGVARERRADWDQGHKRIYTYTTFEVLETVVGKAPMTIEVRSLGGVIGDLGMKVAGSPEFEIGEEAALFLRVDPEDAKAFRVIGMNQGKYKIERPTTGQVFARPTLEGIAFARPDATGGTRVEDAKLDANVPTTWQALRGRIVEARAKLPRPATSPDLGVDRPSTPGATTKP